MKVSSAPERTARRWPPLLIFRTMASNSIGRANFRMLAPPVAQEFGPSDFQVGLLGGRVIALFYVLMAVPIAFCSERHNRDRIIAALHFLATARSVERDMERPQGHGGTA